MRRARRPVVAKAAGSIGVLAAAVALSGCPLLDIQDPISHHVAVRVEVDTAALAPGDTMRVQVFVRSTAEQSIVLRFPSWASCSWRVFLQEGSDTVKYPAVWALRPEGRWTCPDRDPGPIRLDPGETVLMGTLRWDGYVVESDVVGPAHWLPSGVYQLDAMLEYHTVEMVGHEFMADPVLSDPVLVDVAGEIP